MVVEANKVPVTKENCKEGHDPKNPPNVAKDKKPVWHDPYKYKNSKGTEILVKGHWEIINKPKEKPATTTPATPPPAETPPAETEPPKAETSQTDKPKK